MASGFRRRRSFSREKRRYRIIGGPRPPRWTRFPGTPESLYDYTWGQVQKIAKRKKWEDAKAVPEGDWRAQPIKLKYLKGRSDPGAFWELSEYRKRRNPVRRRRGGRFRVRRFRRRGFRK